MSESEDRQKKQYIKMTETPVRKLVAVLAVPAVISMMATNIYSLVDTAFVGTLGTSQSGAVGIVFGYMSILQAIGFLCGQGGGSIMSRQLGRKQQEEANRTSSTSFFMSFTLGLLIAIISAILFDPLIDLLGSTPTIAPYAKEYTRYIIIAAPFMTSSLTLNNLLRYEGKAKLGMIGLMTGNVLNIAGDAIFMFGLDMGVTGAGISTAISQIISFSILLFMFFTGRAQTRIAFRFVSREARMTFNIAATGFPSLLRQALNSISTMVLNNYAAVYHDEAVAAMSIVSRISFFVMAIAIGVGQGFQPVSSFNYGAKKYGRVKEAFWFTFILSEILLVIFAAGAVIFAEPLVRIFRDDELVVTYAIRALRLHCLALLVVPITMVTEMGFQSTGQRLMASVSSSLRSGIVFIPTLAILYHMRGMSGIQEAQPLAFLLSALICVFFSRYYLKDLNQKEKVEMCGETVVK